MIRPRWISIVSSVLVAVCLATTVVWARSWSHPTTFYFMHNQQQCRAWINRGRFGMDNNPQVAIETARHNRDLELMHRIAGLDLMVAPPSPVVAKWSRSSAMLLPVVIVVLAASVVIPFALRKVLSKLRKAPDRCNSCGYNLTGNMSGMCPECGTRVDCAVNKPGVSTTTMGSYAK